MSADDRLDQDGWVSDVELRARHARAEKARAQDIRAAALQAAAAFANRELPWWERETVLELAEMWAAWIETGEQETRA